MMSLTKANFRSDNKSMDDGSIIAIELLYK